jgi:hypothetical protein
MQLAMMGAAERHGEFVADLLSESVGLREPQMMGIAGKPVSSSLSDLTHCRDIE